MAYFVTECLEKIEVVQLKKETITLLIERSDLEGVLKFIADQVEVSKSIAQRYWRALQSPDIFWDDDLMRPMVWKETKPGARRPDGANIWPLWTMEDALDWIKQAGHQFAAVYSFRNPEHVEAYFTYGLHNRLVRIDAKSIILALLLFVDRALKGEYEEQ